MPSQCLIESSPADDRLFPSHLFSEQQLFETFWYYNGGGVICHKVKSALFIKALIFILFEKSDMIGGIWCWLHTEAFVLARYGILAPSKSWEITWSDFHHFFVHKSYNTYTNTHESLGTKYPPPPQINCSQWIHLPKWSRVALWYKFGASLAAILFFSAVSCVLTMKDISRALFLETVLDLFHDSRSLHAALSWAIQKLLH